MKTNTAKTVQVALVIKVEVPIEMWANEYCTAASAEAVRDDFRSYIGGAVEQFPVPCKLIEIHHKQPRLAKPKPLQ